MSKKVLLLNGNCEVLDFLPERKAIKLIFKGKVDVISNWPDNIIFFTSGFLHYPSIVKLKYCIKRRFHQLIFSRNMVFKRDKYCCQYCGRYLSGHQATMDHIIPKSLGGISSFTNCITSCFPCNAKKGRRTLEESGMILLSVPIAPATHLYYLSSSDEWHPEWNFFIKT